MWDWRMGSWECSLRIVGGEWAVENRRWPVLNGEYRSGTRKWRWDLGNGGCKGRCGECKVRSGHSGEWGMWVERGLTSENCAVGNED